MKESDLQKSVCDYLDMVCPDIFYFHIPNSSIMAGVIINLLGPEKGKIVVSRFVNFLKRIGLRPGMADMVLCFGHQRVIFIELKTGIGRLSDDQKTTHRKLLSMGWVVYIVRSLDSLRDVLLKEGAPNREHR